MSREVFHATYIVFTIKYFTTVPVVGHTKRVNCIRKNDINIIALPRIEMGEFQHQHM